MATIVILLLLLSCCWVSFWPLASDAEEPTGPDRGGGSGSIVVSDVEASVVDELDFGPKGLPVRISCTMTALAVDTLFDGAALALWFDAVGLPPVALHGPDAARWVADPALLEKGSATHVAVVFAAPAGSTEATLVVQFPNMPPTEAVVVPVRFGAGESR